jgi:fructose-1-phosphate kinase PfkB-like protein
MLGLTGDSEENRVIELMERYNLQLLALTHGSEGSLLLTPSEKSDLPTPKVQVKDTVGAGDSFTAAMIVGFAKGEPLKNSIKKQLTSLHLFAHRMVQCLNMMTYKYLNNKINGIYKQANRTDRP